MKKTSFRLSAVALSVLFGFSASAVAATSAPVGVPDVSKLNTNTDGQYAGHGSVYIGGSDVDWNKDKQVYGDAWGKGIDGHTSGFESLVKSTGNTTYLDPTTATMTDDANYPIWEDYQRAVHGERLTSILNEQGFSRPANVVEGLRMGSADQRYTKTQNVELYVRDASGAIQYEKTEADVDKKDENGNKIPLVMRDEKGEIQYEKDTDGHDKLDGDGNKIPKLVVDDKGNIQYEKTKALVFKQDEKGNRIPLRVAKNVELDQSSDVYIRPAESTGGEFGLKDAAIYSKVKSFNDDVTAAVTSEGQLRENGWNDHVRDVLVVKDSIIDNTLADDSYITHPADEQNLGEHESAYSARPFAVGMSINHQGVVQQLDSEGHPIANADPVLTHLVPTEANIVLDNVKITAQNLAAVRQDDHGYYYRRDDYSRYADTRSTALQISGSGLFTNINNSTLTGGVNGAGKSLELSGHANRVDISHSTLNGNLSISHDSNRPVIRVAVVKDANGNYSASGASVGFGDESLLRRDRNGNTLNLSNSTLNGDITAGGKAGYEVQLVDVTDKNAQADIDPTVHATAQSIYNNAINSIAGHLIANADSAWTPVAVSLDHSVLNGLVSGTTAIENPTKFSHESSKNALNWNPDLNVKNGSVWNAAADNTHRGDDSEVRISDVHDLNLSASTLNLVNLETNTATLGGHGRYEKLSTARVVVHNNLNQDKDAKGHYLSSNINVGRAVVEPLLDVGGAYRLGSMQVKGSAKGDYWLNMASSGVEAYSKNGYLADDYGDEHGDDTQGHSFVNYKNAGSDAHFRGKTELGVYQYKVVDEYNDEVHGERNVYFKRSGTLSNSAATALSLSAAQSNIATMESDTLSKHLNASRHAKDDGGVWLSYYGGRDRNKLSAGPGYRVTTNGVMVGVDNRFELTKGGNWLAGVAFNYGSSNLRVMNSKGDIDSYGAQFYLSRRYDNGIFVDTQAQFDHFSNTAKVRMLNGGRGHANYSGNGYGLGMKVGYTWEDEGYFAEPYVKATGRSFDSAHYSLSNGMTVRGDDYKSMLGELGVDLGYTFELNQGYIKPYLHLAGLNEFADNNKTHVNNVRLNNSIDGAAFQIGAGAEVKILKDVGGYASLDYTTGDNMERPWQATVGVNYSW